MTISKNMVKRTCYFTTRQWDQLQAAGEVAEMSASDVLRGLVVVFLPTFVDSLDAKSTRQKVEEDEERWHKAPEPLEEPPWCDQCGLYHSDKTGCEV
jgi:hypothetical protein